MTSTVPVIAGKKSSLYVRERALPAVLKSGAGDKVVLFVHGAGTPAEVSFDVPYQDYSWMGYLAAAGYDVFSVDMTGYGRSARPAPMNDKCNLSPEPQNGFGVTCPQSYPGDLTNIESDWNDISAAVAYIKKLRHVDKINLIAWSQGGPRAGGWTANHPDQVSKLILLAPAYSRTAKAEAPAVLPVPGPAFNTQSHDQFTANWERQAPCPGQYDPAAAASVWSEMLKSDPVGASRTPAVRRASHLVHRLGLDAGQSESHDHAHPDGQRHQRQAGQPGTGARLLCRYRQPAESVRRPGLFLPQRHVGEEPPAPVQGLAGMAGQGHRERP